MYHIPAIAISGAKVTPMTEVNSAKVPILTGMVSGV